MVQLLQFEQQPAPEPCSQQGSRSKEQAAGLVMGQAGTGQHIHGSKSLCLLLTCSVWLAVMDQQPAHTANQHDLVAHQHVGV
jgi:hypothetical protein